MARQSLNKVLIIGNLTRDPVLKTTPNGASVCTFGLATNSRYKKPDGTLAEITIYVNIVAWSRLAKICSERLKKGMCVYVEGELRTRKRPTGGFSTEVRITDMKILNSNVKSYQTADSNIAESNINSDSEGSVNSVEGDLV